MRALSMSLQQILTNLLCRYTAAYLLPELPSLGAAVGFDALLRCWKLLQLLHRVSCSHLALALLLAGAGAMLALLFTSDSSSRHLQYRSCCCWVLRWSISAACRGTANCGAGKQHSRVRFFIATININFLQSSDGIACMTWLDFGSLWPLLVAYRAASKKNEREREPCSLKAWLLIALAVPSNLCDFNPLEITTPCKFQQ